MKKLLAFFFLAFPLVTFSQQEFELSSLIKYTGETLTDAAGEVVSSAGDVNGDGYDDFLVGSATNAEGGESSGAAYLILGQEDLLSGGTLSSANTIKFLGEDASNAAGTSIASAGDVNGDGYDDILIGSPANTTKGAAYLIYGSASLNDTTLSATTAVKFTGETAVSSTGDKVASAGDVNGDGFDDILIGAYAESGGGNVAGAAYLVYGQATELSDITLSAATTVKFTGDGEWNLAGHSVSMAGDVNGDGYGDILIGANGNSDNGMFSGAAYLIYGQAAELSDITLSAATTVKFTGEAATNYAGRVVAAAGDVNGDGYDDILIGADGNTEGGENAGATYLVYGQAAALSDITLSSTNTAKFIGTASDGIGGAVSSVGDINHDGYDDIIIGAQLNSINAYSAGAVYIMYGSTSLDDTTLSETTALQFLGEAEEDDAGQSVSSAGDVNNDGYNDFLIGADGNSDGINYTGAVYLGYLFLDGDGDGVTGADGLMPGTDCNDADATVSANQTYYQDLDGDGLGNALVTTSVCASVPPAGYVT
ncbi:MAG: integrin alpha, partial [Patescibacteria group bacterium]